MSDRSSWSSDRWGFALSIISFLLAFVVSIMAYLGAELRAESSSTAATVERHNQQFIDRGETIDEILENQREMRQDIKEILRALHH